MDHQTLPTTTDAPPAALNLFSLDMFRDAWKVAEQLAKSKLIPQNFQNNPPDCIIAMEMAQRIGASIFSVMQSLYIVHGRPGWSAQFIIAAMNSCGRFSPLRFDIIGENDARTCTAWALEKGTGEKLSGPPVSIGMAKDEGWYSKNGSKWQTMPELMLRYRAATFFGRLYAPDILMGMHTADELKDADDIIDVVAESDTLDDLNARFGGKETIDMRTGEIVATPESTLPPVREKKATEPPPPEAQRPAEQQAPEGQGSVAISDVVKKYMREINQASAKGSLAVDQWRMKHIGRVLRDCGGDEGSRDFIEIRNYAQIVFSELERAEREAAGE